MSAGPTASNSMGLIGVELYRLHAGSVSATNFVFAAVQDDLKWVAWYAFFDDASSNDDFRSRWSAGGTRAADHYGRSFGGTKHEFRRVFLHTTRAVRVDGLTGDDKKNAPAVMFVRNSLKKGMCWWILIFPERMASYSFAACTWRAIFPRNLMSKVFAVLSSCTLGRTCSKKRS